MPFAFPAQIGSKPASGAPRGDLASIQSDVWRSRPPLATTRDASRDGLHDPYPGVGKWCRRATAAQVDVCRRRRQSRRAATGEVHAARLRPTRPRVSSGHRVRPGVASTDANVGERVGRVRRARPDHVDGAPPRSGRPAGGVGHDDTDTRRREPVDDGAHRRRARRRTFEAGRVYEYELTAAWAATRGPIPWGDLSLPGATLPTFLAPPANAAELVVYHTSCRKPHGGGRDGLSLALVDMATRFAGRRRRRSRICWSCRATRSTPTRSAIR